VTHDLRDLIVSELDAIAAVSRADHVADLFLRDVPVREGRLERLLGGLHDVGPRREKRTSHDVALLIHDDRLGLRGADVHTCRVRHGCSFPL
jgi:hypothetical protein